MGLCVCVICGDSSVIWGGLLMICGDSGVIWGSLFVIWGDLSGLGSCVCVWSAATRA